MHYFKDSKGDQWPLEITGGTVKRCASLLGIDIGQPLGDKDSKDNGSGPWLTRLDTDIAFFVDLIYVLCKPDADNRDISDEQFAERLDGEAFWLAREALMEELELFFRSRHRTEVVVAVQKQRDLVNAVVGMATEMTERIDVEGLLQSHLGKPGAPVANTPL